MKVLIVEDDSFKLKAIQRVIALPQVFEVQVAESLRDSMTLLEAEQFDFVVLDMAIPSHTSDVGVGDTYSQPVGGLDILLFLSSCIRKERIAILTQHPSVEYDRRHVPLRDLPEVLVNDGIANVTGVVRFTDRGGWEAPLLLAMGLTK